VNPSLSVVLPVHNAEDRLAAQVDELLDVLPDLACRFDVLVVDDGSTDETAHVAEELSICYPQVRRVRHPISLGRNEAIQTGLVHTEGDIVLVGDTQYGLSSDDVVKLWRLRNDDDVMVARKPPRSSNMKRPVLGRLLSWTKSRSTGSGHSPEVQFIRRSALEQFRVDELSAPMARPNFMSRVKAFALGE
jgi:glycosyltransferase involved in cell wall biosynthesis